MRLAPSMSLDRVRLSPPASGSMITSPFCAKQTRWPGAEMGPESADPVADGVDVTDGLAGRPA